MAALFLFKSIVYSSVCRLLSYVTPPPNEFVHEVSDGFVHLLKLWGELISAISAFHFHLIIKLFHKTLVFYTIRKTSIDINPGPSCLTLALALTSTSLVPGGSLSRGDEISKRSALTLSLSLARFRG